MHPFFPTVYLVYRQILIQVLSSKDKECEDSDGKAHLFNELGQLGELDIQWSFFVALFGSLSRYFPNFGSIAHLIHSHDAMTIGYGGSSHYLVAWISRFFIERSFIGGFIHHQFSRQSRFVDL